MESKNFYKKISMSFNQYKALSLGEITELRYEKLWTEYKVDDGAKFKSIFPMLIAPTHEDRVRIFKEMLMEDARDEAKFIMILLEADK